MKKLDSFSPKLSALVQGYLNGNESLRGFYQDLLTYDALKNRHDRISQRQINRSTLVNVVKEQAKGSKYSTDTTFKQIDLLGNSDVSTVTTGHQLCIYGGPMFFLYKILSIISVADKLQKDGRKCVPILWMASEDHDFEEINHIVLNDDKVLWKSEQSGPVGRMNLNDLNEFKSSVVQALRHDYRYSDSLKELDLIFSQGKLLSEATRDFVYWIFADSGVVVIDADNDSLKTLFAPVIRQELELGFSQKALEVNNVRLKELDYSIQVTGREINLFWMKDGYRQRIVRTEDGFETVDGENTWTKDEISILIDSNPECFSPNVILRPVYQEVLLPNIAYIGGPGETSYWLQLKDVFDSAKIEMPLILLRDMFALVTPLSAKKKAQLGIKWQDLFQKQGELIKILIRNQGTHEDIVSKRQKQLESSFNEMFVELSAFDDSLRQNAEAEFARLNNRLESLKKKIFRSDKRKNEVLVQRLDHLYQNVFPSGVPQERVINALAFWPNPNNVLSLLLFCDPFKAEIKIVELD